MLKRVLLSLIFVLALSTMAFADSGDNTQLFSPGAVQSSNANGHGIINTGTINEGSTINGGIKTKANAEANSFNRNTNINRNTNTNTMTQGQAQGQVQGQSQGMNNQLSGNGASNVEVNIQQKGAEIPRNFAIPGQVYYPGMPSEFLNDTQFANAQPVKFILQFGCVYNKIHLQNMKSDGRVKTLQLTNLYGNKVDAADTDEITFLTEIPANLKLVKIGSVITKANSGNTTTEQVLADAGLEALTIKGAKYVLVSGEGLQKLTETSGWGVALGYTHAGISDNGQWAGTGTAGVGYSSGKAGRQANPFIHGVVLTDEATFKTLTKSTK